MTIGRADDPVNPFVATAFEAASVFGTGSRTPSGPAVSAPRRQGRTRVVLECDDHPGPLVERATSWLIVNKVMLAGVSVLERFVGRIRDRAQKRLWKRLVAALDDKQREWIAKLFDETGDTSFAALDALRTVPTQRSPSEFLLHLDRLEAIRAFDLRPSPPQGVPAASLERLARVARAGKPSAIAALHRPRQGR